MAAPNPHGTVIARIKLNGDVVNLHKGGDGMFLIVRSVELDPSHEEYWAVIQ